MTTNDKTWKWSTFISAILVSVISATVIQIVIAAYWTGGLGEKVSATESSIREIISTISRFDVQGTRSVPVLTEKIAALEKLDTAMETRISIISTRLDNFIGQVNRLETPLSKKVEGLEIALITTRDAANVHVASSAARIDNIVARQNSVYEKLAAIDKDFTDLRSRIAVLDGLTRELKNLSDQRQLVVQRAEKGFEDIALLREQISTLKANTDEAIKRIDERTNRIVQALDNINDQLQQHLRDYPVKGKKSSAKSPGDR